jgi:membrane protease YdiL (CAAX protease family)
VVAVLYLAVVALFRLAFTVFTATNVLGLFLCFGAGLVLGVAAPVFYTVGRGRSLSDLGLWLGNWQEAVVLGLVLAAIQFAITLWGYALPAPVDWVPLLVMSLTVGAFETVFFRGFVQTRLSASLGPIPGVALAAALYAAYHVGYGMTGEGMIFLFGLGVVYAVAFALVRNVLVLWPLLTPLGSFFNNLSTGDIELPWEAILGFADVLGLMAAAVWLGRRRLRKAAH